MAVWFEPSMPQPHLTVVGNADPAKPENRLLTTLSGEDREMLRPHLQPVGVTQAVHVLEGEHLINAKRGLLTVRNRKALEERAAQSYGISEAEYERSIGPFGKGRKL
jgi:hypothetical protein